MRIRTQGEDGLDDKYQEKKGLSNSFPGQPLNVEWVGIIDFME